MNAVERMATSDWFRNLGPKIVPPIDRFVNRVSGGRWTMTGLYTPTIVLTTVGRKSGQPRDTPLATFPHGDSFIIVGSNFAKANHPAWSYNLLANPSATVQYRGKTIPVTARMVSAEEKAELWPKITKQLANFEKYPERSGRDLRVFMLEPT